MRAKRLDVRAFFVAVAALAVSAGSLAAQQTKGVFQPPRGPARGRVAVATPPPTIVAVTPTVFDQRLNPNSLHQRQVVFNQVPTILLSNGTVFANFGSGFEPVRSCGTVAIIAGEPRVVAGDGTVLSRPAGPTYTQPVPNQTTASQQLSSYTRTFGGSAAAQASCFTRDRTGNVFVNQFR